MAQEVQSSLKPTRCGVGSSSCWIVVNIRHKWFIWILWGLLTVPLLCRVPYTGRQLRKDATLQLSGQAGLNLCPKWELRVLHKQKLVWKWDHRFAPELCAKLRESCAWVMAFYKPGEFTVKILELLQSLDEILQGSVCQILFPVSNTILAKYYLITDFDHKIWSELSFLA